MKFNELKKRWTGLGLAFVLSLSAVASVSADTASVVSTTSVSTDQVETPEITEAEAGMVVADSVVNAESDADDTKVSEETIDNDLNSTDISQENQISDDLGNASSEKEEEIIDDATSENADAAEEKPVIEVTDPDATEKTMTISVKNLKKGSADEVVRAAVWSADKGQDDLRWYELNYSSSEELFKKTINIADHKSNGHYYVHLYVFSKTGNTFIGESSFQITPAKADTLEITDLKPDGTATVTLTGVQAPSGIKEVLFPIWSTANQSDICWYKGTEVAAGVYQIKMDIAKHSYHYGTYHIHTYGTNGIGAQSFLLSSSCEILRGDVALQADPSDNGYLIKASNLNLSNASSVKFAVWSKKNGQDDLVWLDVKPSASGNVSVNWVPKEFDDYYIHCYIRTSTGQMLFQKDLTLTVKGPKIGKMAISSDINTGAFTIKLTDVEESSLIKKVLVPVWSDPKQADIVWYNAAKQADGSYIVDGTIAKHKFNTGKYNAHVYLTDVKGMQTFQLADSFNMDANCDSVTVEEKTASDGSLAAFTAHAENVVIPGGTAGVSFAVWSADKGQDDIVWYNGTADGNNWSASINLSRHISAGKFYVHCYADAKSGKKVFLGAAEFTVELSAKASVSVVSTDDKAGTITLSIQIDEKSAAIDKLLVPVWVNADKSDLYTYTAEKESDDTWTVTVKASNHGYNFGTYSVHVDAVFTLGLSVPAADFTTDFAPEKFLSVEKTGNGKRLVKISNVPSTVQKVTFPTWSDTSGQDDIYWYTGKKNSDGSWSAEITSANLKHAGKVITHCYVDDAMAGFIECEFTEDEMQTVGSKKVHQYAQELIKANGGDLYRIYKWVVNSYRYTTKPVPVPYPSGYTRQEFYFTDAYETRVTNCFGFAATFYWCAKEMGYDVKLIEGRVRYRSGAYGPHGWVEVYKNGTTYICDPELEYEKSINSYMVTYASSPFSYQPTMPAY